MKLEMFIGILAAAMTVLGGIVSAHAPSNPKQKMGYAITFVVIGVVMVALIFVQAKRTEMATTRSEEQRTILVKDIKESKDSLAEQRQMLLASQLALEHMKGQLEGIGQMAGRIGEGTDNNMKQLVGAINRISESSHVGTLTNKQLCDRTKEFTRRLRKFNSDRNDYDRRMSDMEMPLWIAAKTDEEKQQSWKKLSDASSQRYQERAREFQGEFWSEALFLRDQISRRLPSVAPPSESSARFMFLGASSSPSLQDGANYLDQLAKELCP